MRLLMESVLKIKEGGDFKTMKVKKEGGINEKIHY